MNNDKVTIELVRRNGTRIRVEADLDLVISATIIRCGDVLYVYQSALTALGRPVYLESTPVVDLDETNCG